MTDKDYLTEIVEKAKSIGEDVRKFRELQITGPTTEVKVTITEPPDVPGGFLAAVKEFMDEPSEPEAFWYGMVHAWTRLLKRVPSQFRASYLEWIEKFLDEPEMDEATKKAIDETIAHDYHYYEFGFYTMRVVQLVLVYIFRQEIMEFILSVIGKI